MLWPFYNIMHERVNRFLCKIFGLPPRPISLTVKSRLGLIAKDLWNHNTLVEHQQTVEKCSWEKYAAQKTLLLRRCPIIIIVVWFRLQMVLILYPSLEITVGHHLWKSVFEYNFQLWSWKLYSKTLFHRWCPIVISRLALFPYDVHKMTTHKQFCSIIIQFVTILWLIVQYRVNWILGHLSVPLLDRSLFKWINFNFALFKLLSIRCNKLATSEVFSHLLI